MLLLQPGQPGSLVPVYQCLHAFDVLGQRSAFEEYYAENRRVRRVSVHPFPSAFSRRLTGRPWNTRTRTYSSCKPT